MPPVVSGVGSAEEAASRGERGIGTLNSGHDEPDEHSPPGFRLDSGIALSVWEASWVVDFVPRSGDHFTVCSARAESEFDRALTAAVFTVPASKHSELLSSGTKGQGRKCFKNLQDERA